MLSDDEKHALNASILDAQTVADLEAPINDGLLSLFGRQTELLLADVWYLVDLVRVRITTIRSLRDLGDGDDRAEQNNRTKISNWFGRFCEILASFDLHVTAVGLLVELWNQLGEYQSEINRDTVTLRHIYRAGIGMYLGRILLQKEPGAAIWWLLHAQADDLLNEHADKGGAGRDMLRLSFGVSDRVFEYMDTCADESLKIRQPYALFAEHVVMQLSLEAEYNHLFSYPTALTDFPIDRAYAASMLSRIEKTPEGKPLEEFARYLVLLLSGWVPTKNLYHLRTDIDSDLVARYVREPESISSARTRAILVECKNIDRTLSVSAVGYFLYRMHLTQVRVGILFAKRNVSGRSSSESQTDDRNAKHLIDLAFQRDGSVVIVIDLDDLRDLVKGQKTIWSLIDSRIVERRFGSPRSGAADS